MNIFIEVLFKTDDDDPSELDDVNDESDGADRE